MTYKQFLINNRRDYKAEIKNMVSISLLKREVLAAYDFAAIRAIEAFQSYQLLKEAIVEEYGEEAFDKLLKATYKKSLTIGDAIAEYADEAKRDDTKYE